MRTTPAKPVASPAETPGPGVGLVGEAGSVESTTLHTSPTGPVAPAQPPPADDACEKDTRSPCHCWSCAPSMARPDTAQADTAGIDVARIRSDMARNQYAEPEDTERLIVALTKLRAEVVKLEARMDVALAGTDDLAEFTDNAHTKLDRIIDLMRMFEDDLVGETASLQTTAAAWGRNVRHSDELRAEVDSLRAQLSAAQAATRAQSMARCDEELKANIAERQSAELLDRAIKAEARIAGFTAALDQPACRTPEAHTPGCGCKALDEFPPIKPMENPDDPEAWDRLNLPTVRGEGDRPAKHEFTEDVTDMSMCVCGIPALYHDAWEQRDERPAKDGA